MVNVTNMDILEKLYDIPKILICLGKMLPGIILITISKYCHITNQVSQKCFLFKIYKKRLLDKYQSLNWVKILIKNLITSQRLTKGLNELVNMLITFMVFT